MTFDQLLDALAVGEGLPRDAMVAAGECREEITPVFLDQIDRLRQARIDTVDEADLSSFLFVYFLLAEWRETRAYRPLTALLRRDSDILDLLLGDAITEATARVIAGVFDGDLQPIFAVIEDHAADEFVRGQMIDALVMIAHHSPEARPEVTDYLERFFAAEMDKPTMLWGSWAFAVADLGLAHLEPQVRQAFQQEWISPDEADFDFFQEQLRHTLEGNESRFQRNRNGRPIDSAVEELSRWHCFSDKFLRERETERASGNPLSYLFSDTFERKAPKVGRNDPCPCGSGKKFKKCCLH